MNMSELTSRESAPEENSISELTALELHDVVGGTALGAVGGVVAGSYALVCVGIGIYEGLTNETTDVGDKWCN